MITVHVIMKRWNSRVSPERAVTRLLPMAGWIIDVGWHQGIEDPLPFPCPGHAQCRRNRRNVRKIAGHGISSFRSQMFPFDWIKIECPVKLWWNIDNFKNWWVQG